jgi:hypothetical protein
MVSRFENIVRRALRLPAFWVTAAVLILSVAVNLFSEMGRLGRHTLSAQEPRSMTGREAIRLREGSSLTDALGRFQIVGDSLMFTPSDNPKAPIRCLPNLMLQRIHQSIRDDDRGSEWIVQGKITEYFDDNFLLIERAIRAPRPARK